MIGRLWRGATHRADAAAYRRFLAEDLLPGLLEIDGYRGACVLTRKEGDEVEFVTLTFFESMDAVRAFAGPTPEKPVIEAEAARLLVHIGERVEHLDVAIDQRPG
jgi:heme-degrading monooxygenase HmoA